MSLSSEEQFLCPYCGQPNDISIDSAEGRQYEFVTDCEVCCRPIVVHVKRVGLDYEIEAHAENE